MSLVPFVGGVLSEAFTTIVTEPSSKRRDNILMLFDERINEVASRVDGLEINILKNDGVFLSTVLQAFQIAMRTHQQEKIAALLNAITNAALSENVEENEQHMFLMVIDSFTELHLRLLLFFYSPDKLCQEKGLKFPDFVLKDNLINVTEKIFPDLKGKFELYSQVSKDLFLRGLLNNDPFNLDWEHNSMNFSVTPMGKQFIDFISQTN